ncbi:MAG TPA: tetratricopeptide repeat protein, partial [Polyangia bacterium]|nr:tetratricopeptide repeat protein [Polyangia bacterium]
MTRSDRGLASVGISAFFSMLLLSWVALTAPARAAGPDEAAAGARVLFGEGRKLADAGRYAEACLKFEESLRLDPGQGTSFNLADCQEHLGRTASAWARFLDVAAATRLAGQPERERVARARATALEPRLARLAIVVPWPDDRLVVLRDGRPVGASAWGIPVPVDPGTHRVEATAPARKTWSQDTTVPDAPTTVEVSVPRLEIVPVLPAPLSGSLLPEGIARGAAPSDL